MKVMKFGGNSFENGADIINVGKIINNEPNPRSIILVLSAMKNVTDSLINASNLALNGSEDYKEICGEIRLRHINTAREILPPKEQSKEIANIQLALNELEDILRGIELIKERTPRTLDLILSFGERLSCGLFASYLNAINIPAEFCDARQFIITDNNHGASNVDFDETEKRTKAVVSKIQGIPVIPGFVASTLDGVTTTLGRNGSDYSASIIGSILDAEIIEIYTNFDGMMTADPEIVSDAKVIEELNYQEAMEMSYFGAKCVHPLCLLPVIEKSIPIRVKNVYNPSLPGTLITANPKSNGSVITGIASIPNIALLNIEGGGMIGIPGFASRIFTALAKAGVNIIMITQASSEHSICLAFKEAETENALNALNSELSAEIQSKRIQKLMPETGLEIIAVVSDKMRGTPGIAGKIFNALGSIGVNLLALAQGSSERNVSFVIKQNDTKKAVTALYQQCVVNWS